MINNAQISVINNVPLVNKLLIILSNVVIVIIYIVIHLNNKFKISPAINHAH